MNERDNFALVPRPPGAVAKGEPGAKRILSDMVGDTLALAQAKSRAQSLSALQPYASADLDSWFQKGANYYYGRGVPQDFTQAVHWYRKAAEQAHTDAQFRLGWCYFDGHGVPQDFAQAVHWHRKAAEQGDTDAQCTLGWCYFIGKGVPQDFAQAVHWHRKGAEQGNAIAQFSLGWCYATGRSVPKNPVAACKWFRLAAEQGHSRAKDQFADLSTLMSPAELAESERLYEEHSKRKQS
jgi:TPR repeat protein